LSAAKFEKWCVFKVVECIVLQELSPLLKEVTLVACLCQICRCLL